MEKSANGWPASADPEEIAIIRKRVPGTDLKLGVARPVAPLLIAFAADFHRLIEPLDEGQLDDWGYCYRKVRGSQAVISNHASGTAIDLNATKHPLGKEGTFSQDQIKIIRRLCRKYGLKWGGDYRYRKDEMHVEIALNSAQVSTLISALDLEKTNDKDKTEQAI